MTGSIKARCGGEGGVAHRWSLQLLAHVALIALACMSANVLASEFETADEERAIEAAAGEWRTVTRAIDGDTLVLGGGERVPLIGVDTRAYLREATLRAVRNPGMASLSRELKSSES